MNKDQLLGIYRTKLNHVQLTYASLVLWSYPGTPKFFESLHSQLPGILRLYPQLPRLLHDQAAMQIACEELYDSAHRAAVKELFALTKLYCHQTNQLPKMKAQDWYEFWRIVRNCWSHDMTFNFNAHEKAVLPITWSGVTIDVSMNGQHLTHGDCSREKLLELIESARAFVEHQLN